MTSSRKIVIARAVLEPRLLAGDSLSAIAADLGVSKDTVHSRAIELEIPCSPVGARRILPPAEALVAAVAAGELLREIGDRYCLTGEAVGDALRRAGYRRVGGVYQKNEAA